MKAISAAGADLELKLVVSKTGVTLDIKRPRESHHLH